MFQKDNLLMVKRINTGLLKKEKKEKSWCSCIGYFILIFFSFIFTTAKSGSCRFLLFSSMYLR